MIRTVAEICEFYVKHMNLIDLVDSNPDYVLAVLNTGSLLIRGTDGEWLHTPFVVARGEK